MAADRTSSVEKERLMLRLRSDQELKWCSLRFVSMSARGYDSGYPIAGECVGRKKAGSALTDYTGWSLNRQSRQADCPALFSAKWDNIAAMYRFLLV